MFEFHREQEGERVQRYFATRGERPLPYSEALDCWQHDSDFRAAFVTQLREAPFGAYRFETPPICNATSGRPFELVLLDAPGLDCGTDARTFAEHHEQRGEGIAVFENLGGDAVLVVPAPRAPERVYSHLAAFVRGAPASQVDALWIAVGREVRRRLSQQPLWLSTAGGGVAWLHVRLDSRPKYYGYAPYRRELRDEHA